MKLITTLCVVLHFSQASGTGVDGALGIGSRQELKCASALGEVESTGLPYTSRDGALVLRIVGCSLASSAIRFQIWLGQSRFTTRMKLNRTGPTALGGFRSCPLPHPCQAVVNL
jgi:hypothetical protein